jgi:hypothetical protein
MHRRERWDASVCHSRARASEDHCASRSESCCRCAFGSRNCHRRATGLGSYRRSAFGSRNLCGRAATVSSDQEPLSLRLRIREPPLSSLRIGEPPPPRLQIWDRPSAVRPEADARAKVSVRHSCIVVER